MSDDNVKLGFIVSVVVLILGAVIYVATYKQNIDTTVTDMYWKRTIDVLQYQTFSESAWDESVPSNARIKYTNWEYKTSYQKYTHSTYSTYSYSCGTSKKPKTCTRRTETKHYRTVSVYDTKVYYDIDRWVNIAPLVIDGHDKELVSWPKNPNNYPQTAADIVGNIKLGYTHEVNQILFFDKDGNKGYTYDCPFEEWNTYYKGHKQRLTINIFGKILEVHPSL